MCVCLDLYASHSFFKKVIISFFSSAGGNQDGKFSVGFRDGVVRTVVNLDRETVSSYTLILEAIGEDFLWNTFVSAISGMDAHLILPHLE